MRWSRHVVSAASFIVCASAAGAQQAASPPVPIVYVKLDYMKVNPGKDGEYLRLEQQVWKPFHQERVKAKDMLAWRLYAVPYTADTHREYDYVTVNIYDNLAATEGTKMVETFSRLHPGQASSRLLAQTGDARQMVRSEIWRLLDGTAPRSPAAASAAPSKYLVLGYMRSKPGGSYVAVERELWKPIHQQRVASGASDGWELFELVLPGGASYPYDYATVSAMGSIESIADPYPSELFQRVHPTIPLADIMTRTMAGRDLTRQELWVLVDATR